MSQSQTQEPNEAPEVRLVALLHSLAAAGYAADRVEVGEGYARATGLRPVGEPPQTDEQPRRGRKIPRP